MKLENKRKSKKQMTENQTRNGILTLAKAQGCEMEAKQILDRYDRILRNCTNEQEKRHISIMGIAELHKLLNCKGALVVNGVEILPESGECPTVDIQ